MPRKADQRRAPRGGYLQPADDARLNPLCHLCPALRDIRGNENRNVLGTVVGMPAIFGKWSGIPLSWETN
jgi:hypothetical protein